jgi:hypothetical protein
VRWWGGAGGCCVLLSEENFVRNREKGNREKGKGDAREERWKE